jgi:hypothetical protein
MMGQLLQTDDIIQIGRIRLRFRRTTETAAAPAGHEAPDSKAAGDNGRRPVESRNRTGRADDERHRHSQIRTEPVRPVAPARSKIAHAPSETESDPFDTETWRDQPELREDGEDDAIKTQPYRPN